jgi:DNA invertase Pin-like site-specific DNA recombinase
MGDARYADGRYLRQSTLRQVLEHRESTARQYDLRERAVTLGWSAAQVDVIDDDLEQSGTSTHARDGFQRLAQDVAHGRVGAIFSLEVSRLARSSADWHQLLDLCGLQRSAARHLALRSLRASQCTSNTAASHGARFISVTQS